MHHVTNNSKHYVIEWIEPSLITIPSGGIKKVLSFERSVHVADYSYLPLYPVKIPEREIYDIKIGLFNLTIVHLLSFD